MGNEGATRRQLTGVAVPGLGDTLARVLALMGAEHALIVHGEDGLDEISIGAPTQVNEAKRGEVRAYRVEPEQFGLRRAPTDAVRGGNVVSGASPAYHSTLTVTFNSEDVGKRQRRPISSRLGA